MRLKSYYLWIAATLLVGMLPGSARADSWAQWRFDGANTGFNARETLAIPIPNLFWFSADVKPDFPNAVAIKTFGPVVGDVKRAGDVTPDHVVFVARENRLYAYRPNTQEGGSNGTLDPIQGWPFNFQRVGEGNSPDDGASGIIQAPPIFAHVTGINGSTAETRDVVFVLTGSGTSSGSGEVQTDDFLTLHAIALPADFPRTLEPQRLWSRRIRGIQQRPVPLAGAAYADIGDASLSIPLIFVTTKEGRLHAINVRPIDTAATGAAGSPKPGGDRWIYTTPIPTGGGNRPTFAAGPAVARAALTGFPANVQPAAAKRNREWLTIPWTARGPCWRSRPLGRRRERATTSISTASHPTRTPPRASRARRTRAA